MWENLLNDGEFDTGAGFSLVVIAFPGVQRFIAEARSTLDVHAASDIYSRLAMCAVKSLDAEPSVRLIFPVVASDSLAASQEHGMPNRVVALLPAAKGDAAPEEAAKRAVKAATDAWQGWAGSLWSRATVETPGFPSVHWACVPEMPGGYAEQWRQAQVLLAARRRVRDFPSVPEDEWRERVLCSLTPRWPAEPSAPPGAPKHEQATRLSTVGWVKRSWRRMHGLEGFPSTLSIASAPYRAGVLRRMGEDAKVRAAVVALWNAERQVRDALEVRGHEAPVPELVVPGDEPGHWLTVDGGPWVYADRWRPEILAREQTRNPAAQRELSQAIARPVTEGREAARRLAELIPLPLASYLAVVVQDIDGMGAFLGGATTRNSAGKAITITVSPGAHGDLSGQLLTVAASQRAALKSAELLSQPVYVGGDDLLAFTPAARALDA
jgi:CRISPR-associated protein Cmr2